MQVETYEVTESTADGVECDAEAMKLIESLGLTGQMDRVTAPTGTRTRNPYRRMTREEEHVYSILMPKKAEISKYADGPIPLRVLQVAAHGKGMFDYLEVWCPETGPQDDPILIGCNVDPQHRYIVRERFMLARWGECLLAFEKLTEKAAKIGMGRVEDKLKQIKRDVSTLLDAVPTMSTEGLLRLANNLPHYHANLD